MSLLCGKQLIHDGSQAGMSFSKLSDKDRIGTLPEKYGKDGDISLGDLVPKTVTDFERFLFVECGCYRNTAMKCIQQFKRVVTLAHNNGMISINPFSSYEFHFESSDRGYLSGEELASLIQYPVACPMMEATRDVFVFCCFTGLSYIDVKASLYEDNIQRRFDGHLWIQTKQQKTNVQSNIRLLSVPQQIIEKYRGKCSGSKVLPVPFNCPGGKVLKNSANCAV